jgi:hypothetical protein
VSTLHLYAIDAATAELALDPHFSLRLTGAARKTICVPLPNLQRRGSTAKIAHSAKSLVNVESRPPQ